MARQIVIEFDWGTGGCPDIHRVRNFNDALYSLAREHDFISFSLDQLDKLTDQRVAIKSARKVQRVSALIENLIREHGFGGIARSSVIVPQD